MMSSQTISDAIENTVQDNLGIFKIPDESYAIYRHFHNGAIANYLMIESSIREALSDVDPIGINVLNIKS